VIRPSAVTDCVNRVISAFDVIDSHGKHASRPRYEPAILKPDVSDAYGGFEGRQDRRSISREAEVPIDTEVSLRKATADIEVMNPPAKLFNPLDGPRYRPLVALRVPQIGADVEMDPSDRDTLS
jgi:hypothetical protein